MKTLVNNNVLYIFVKENRVHLFKGSNLEDTSQLHNLGQEECSTHFSTPESQQVIGHTTRALIKACLSICGPVTLEYSWCFFCTSDELKLN
jgi:hypothetical protein